MEAETECDDGVFDDWDVPLSSVIEDALQLTIPDTEAGELFCADSSVIEPVGQGLQSGGVNEDIWSYHDDGTPWLASEDESINR